MPVPARMLALAGMLALAPALVAGAAFARPAGAPAALDEGAAADAGDEPAYQPDQSQPPVMVTEGIEAVRGSGALLRGLDKVTGRTIDIPLAVGEASRFGRLEVRLGECRYPAGNPASDAYAQLIISDLVRRQVLFSGWMIASSPALSALDDARYDIWVVACKDRAG